MKKDIHYLSFGASEPHELNRQLSFCKYVALYLETDFSFYRFLFPDEEHQEMDDVTFVPLDQLNHFFEIFEPTLQNETIIFNHAFFYPKIISFLGGDHNVFIYHKLDLEYLLMKRIGLDVIDFEMHLKRELYLLDHCDWMYTSSEALLHYIQENHGYHQHKCSVIPHFPLVFSERSSEDFNSDFYDSGIHFLHIGPVSNRGIRYIKKILDEPNNKMTVIADNLTTISKQGFRKDPRLKTFPFKLDALNYCLNKIDYGLVRPKPDVLEWIRVHGFLLDYLSHGISVLMPKEFKTNSFNEDELGIQKLESFYFNVSKNDIPDKNKIKTKAQAIFCQSEIHNSIKFRNLKSLYLGMVNKSY